MLKIAGLFGSYNPIVIAMTISMFCMMIAMVRYSYFDSLQAAVDNAFNHGNEGLIILDGEDRILFVNHRMKELFPDIRAGNRIGKYQEICELLHDKGRLLHRDGVAYELRTPMNTMLGMNEMILRESSEEEIKSYAKEVAGAGAHMISLIDEVLDASQLESGTVTIVKRPYQISGVIRQAPYTVCY